MALFSLGLRQDNDVFSGIDVAIFLLIFGITLMAYLGIPSYIMFNLDPIHYILYHSKILNNSIYLKNFILILARIISLLCIQDCVRTYTVFLTLVLDSVSNTYSIPTILAANFNRIPCRYTLLFCRLTLLVYKLIQEAFEIFGSIALSMIFWAISILIAVIVQKSADIDPLILGILFLAAATTCFTVFVTLHVISKIVKKSQDIVCHCEFMSKLVYTETKNAKFKSVAKIIWYEAKAVRPIKVQFKPFCNIDKSFVMNYVQNVRGRVFDMILIF